MKKRFFSLVEIVISLSLIAIILFFLFNHFVFITKYENKIQSIKKQSFKQAYLHSKLAYIFNQLSIENPIFYLEKEKNNNLYSLNFFFDNGIDISPNFSHFLFGKIYVNKKKELILETLSDDKKNKREEILFNNITDLTYQFYFKEDISFFIII